jgi:hypothetical protein
VIRELSLYKSVYYFFKKNLTSNSYGQPMEINLKLIRINPTPLISNGPS